jgi:membrane dipeptidase
LTTPNPSDRRANPAHWAAELGISHEAVALYLSSEVIDLHLDSFIWSRVFGYDLRRRHGRGALNGWFFGHADFPRIRAARVTGAVWSLTTNPARSATERSRAFHENLRQLSAAFRAEPSDFQLVGSHAEYVQARHAGKHAALLGIQGGNALGAAELDALDRHVVRVTLVHLTSSAFGATSSPLKRRDAGLLPLGVEAVRILNHRRIFVDLAHISPRGFHEAVSVHDRSQPLMVSHTGVSGVYPHWRNIDDVQIRAVAATGGVVGIIYHAPFLGDRLWRGRIESIVRHLEHVRRVGGEDAPSLGSDWDGAIVPPPNLRSCEELPRVVQTMLDRGWTEDQIRNTLGRNFLRAFAQLRG